jgi:cytoskeletal protein RodZ
MLNITLIVIMALGLIGIIISSIVFASLMSNPDFQRTLNTIQNPSNQRSFNKNIQSSSSIYNTNPSSSKAMNFDSPDGSFSIDENGNVNIKTKEGETKMTMDKDGNINTTTSTNAQNEDK